MSEYYQGGERREQNKFSILDVKGDLDLVRKKLRANLMIAFLVSRLDHKLYVSSNNTHIDAARKAGFSSNTSDSILVKGRIMPASKTFTLLDFYSARKANPDIDCDDLAVNCDLALSEWLGSEFSDYYVVKSNDSSTSVGPRLRPYEGD